MKVYVQMKAAGRKKPVLEDVPYEIPEPVFTLRNLLTAFVRMEVERYNEKGTDTQMLPYLTGEEIENQAAAGKVGFGRVYSEKKADAAKAVENAVQCFEDGLIRVFQEDQELTGLDEAVHIEEGSRFTLIRLTFLAGRLW